MLHRLLPANPTLADRFSFFLYWLFEGMYGDWRRRGLTHVHRAEIEQRIWGMWKRLRSVLERYRAGTLRAPRGRKGVLRKVTPHPDPPPQGGRERIQTVGAGWRSVLPRRFGWLKSLILPDRQWCVTQFNLLLYGNEEMQAVIAAAPQQIGRVLRPFCHFLGLEVPPELRLPRRVRKRDPSRRAIVPGEQRWAEAHPTALGLEVPAELRLRRRRTPREVAEEAIARSERTGKPIDPRKIGAVAYGYVLHWPRDGNCPPPEIGYGGRWRRPPRDYKPPGDGE